MSMRNISEGENVRGGECPVYSPTHCALCSALFVSSGCTSRCAFVSVAPITRPRPLTSFHLERKCAPSMLSAFSISPLTLTETFDKLQRTRNLAIANRSPAHLQLITYRNAAPVSFKRIAWTDPVRTVILN